MNVSGGTKLDLVIYEMKFQKCKNLLVNSYPRNKAALAGNARIIATPTPLYSPKKMKQLKNYTGAIHTHTTDREQTLSNLNNHWF